MSLYAAWLLYLLSGYDLKLPGQKVIFPSQEVVLRKFLDGVMSVLDKILCDPRDMLQW